MQRSINKYISISLISAALFSFTITLSFAQDQLTPFEKTYEQYLQSIENYNNNHSDYILARSQHLKFQTLNSQEKAKKETIEMLEARDEVVISYLKTLKERLNEINDIDDSTKQSLQIELDDELEWFNNHKSSISTAGTLEDLVKDSDEADERYKSIQSLLYQVLGNISSAKVTGYRNRYDDNYTKLREKVNSIKNETRPDYSFDSTKLNQIDRWFFESDNKLIRSEEKKLEADELVLNMSARRGGNSSYNGILTKLGESQQFILESLRQAREIAKEVRRK